MDGVVLGGEADILGRRVDVGGLGVMGRGFSVGKLSRWLSRTQLKRGRGDREKPQAS